MEKRLTTLKTELQREEERRQSTERELEKVVTRQQRQDHNTSAIGALEERVSKLQAEVTKHLALPSKTAKSNEKAFSYCFNFRMQA